LAALFAAFFVAPLCVLIVMSLSTDAEMHGLTIAHYANLHRPIQLLDPLEHDRAPREGDAAVLLFGFPDRLDLRARQGALADRAAVPGDSADHDQRPVCARSPGSSSWERQGVLTRSPWGLGLTSEPLRLLFTSFGVVIVLAQCRCR